MRLLLDTHTFLWWDSQPTKLPAKVLALCEDTQNEIFLSVASIWEMQIKHQLSGQKPLSHWITKLNSSGKSPKNLIGNPKP